MNEKNNVDDSKSATDASEQNTFEQQKIDMQNSFDKKFDEMASRLAHMVTDAFEKAKPPPKQEPAPPVIASGSVDYTAHSEKVNDRARAAFEKEGFFKFNPANENRIPEFIANNPQLWEDK